MPPDIRNFFGGKGATPIRTKETKIDDESPKDSQKRKSSKAFEFSPQIGPPKHILILTKGRKVIEDSDDDEPAP